ncbi:Phage integrase [Sphingobium yanoikuyae]|uniref:Phage integrase n=1 Tax=Sphingobium yanoikuyae TaxID=13690 RepID=A0A084EN63_SPHYA|nr:site-specific integrase [Sphingobium yanoikuyae]KEZ19405.1 Phage integrase [Sphingobium yanoikuyae]
MATGKVIKRTVDALRAAGIDGFLWDEDLKGFGVRTLTSGAATYVLQYRMGGREAKTRRYTIGSHGSPWTPVTARAEAERLQILVAQGIDPAEADKQRRREAVDLAFSNYADRFTKSCDPRGWGRVVEQGLRLHIKPVLRDKALTKITRIDVVEVFDRMPPNQQANRRNVFAVLRRLFKWAISRGDIDRSPMEGMETPPAVKARDRWLSDDELRRIWTVAPQTHRCFGPIVRLLIVTGQRREEVSSLSWAEVSRADRLWRLPSERAKNGEPNSVPLNDLAIAILDEVAHGHNWPRRGRVFATSTGHNFTAYDKGKKKVDKLLTEDGGAPVAPWRLHDLRRTVATGLQRLGVRFEVTEAILNHVGASRSGVAAIYQRHDWKTEKEQAMRDWGSHLQAVLGHGPSLVPASADFEIDQAA